MCEKLFQNSKQPFVTTMTTHDVMRADKTPKTQFTFKRMSIDFIVFFFISYRTTLILSKIIESLR